MARLLEAARDRLEEIHRGFEASRRLLEGAARRLDAGGGRTRVGSRRESRMMPPVESANGDAAERTALVRTIMRRQARLGLRIAAVFVLILVGLPLLNLYLPDAMAAPVGGFSLGWLLLAVLFYPVTWLLSWVFVRGSDRAEDAIVAEMRETVAASLAAPVPAPEGDPAPGKGKLFVEDER